MKKKNLFGAFACAVLLSACGSSKSAIDYAAPEEQGLNIQKITDESSNTVLGSSTETASTKKGGFWGTLGSITKMDNFALSSRGGCRNAKYYWGILPTSLGVMMEISISRIILMVTIHRLEPRMPMQVASFAN